MTKTMRDICLEYLSAVKQIYGAHLQAVILYGSYARGDYTPDSDVDMMILVDLREEDIHKYADQLSEIGFEFNVTKDVWIMPVVQNSDHFKKWVSAYPFYANVQKEGVTLYEAA